MDIDQFVMKLNAVDWRNFAGSMYEPERVADSLTSLALADQESKEGVYQIEGVEADLLLNAKIASDVMFAIGNDHSGTYYPAVCEALPFIIQVAIFGNHLVARNCAINILIDLYYFCPEDESADLEELVKDAIRAAIIENRKNFTEFAINSESNRSLIDGLLEIVDD